MFYYIQPHSAHSPGVLSGLVMGNVLHMYQRCSSFSDSKSKIKDFYCHLLRRGYKSSTLLPMFQKAIDNAKAYLSHSEENNHHAYNLSCRDAAECQAYFHLLFHPDNPPPNTIQCLWREHVSVPVRKEPFNELTNHEDEESPLDQLILAFHRAPNLGNRFSYRKITEHSGPKISPRLHRQH